MSAHARPHKRSTSKPEVCPHCGHQYTHRVRRRDDDEPFSWPGYRHPHGGFVYLHTPAQPPGGDA